MIAGCLEEIDEGLDGVDGLGEVAFGLLLLVGGEDVVHGWWER